MLPRLLLYGASLYGGGCVLAMEILGARMLTPFFGSSHFVWTAQIAITLVALAAGYWLGGRVSVCFPPMLVAAALMVAGSFAALSPLIVPVVSLNCLRLGLPLGSFCASGILFFVPLSLLAALSPILVQWLSAGIGTVGTTAGRVGLISTIGSVLGVIASGYLVFSDRIVLVSIGAGLVVLGWLLFLAFRPIALPQVVLVGSAISVAVAFFGLSRWPEWRFRYSEELESENSPFGVVKVLSQPENSSYFYLNDFLVVNTYNWKEKRGHDAYTYLLELLAQSYAGKFEDALCIGMAAGIVPNALAKRGVHVDAVEINPAALRVAVKYFDLDTNRVHVIIQDGRYVLNNTTRQYDVVIVDAYVGESAPNHLLSREAFQQMHRVLKSGGILAISSAASAGKTSNFFVASVQKTLRAVFRNVRIHDTRAGNAFFVASDEPLIQRNVVAVESVPEAIRGVVGKTLNRGSDAELEGGIVITDDFNPLDFHEAANRQAIRRRILEHLQTL